MKNHKVDIINKLYIIGRGNVLVVKKDNYHINDCINNEYIIKGIEILQHSPTVGLIVREINQEDIKDGGQ